MITKHEPTSSQHGNLPEELRKSPQFLNFIYVPNEAKGKPDKVPVNPHTLGNGSSTNPKTWGNFEKALGRIGKEAAVKINRPENGKDKWILHKGDIAGLGIGIAYGVSAIDIDNCVDDSGLISEMAMDIIERMDSYTEYSPSGKGIRILFKAALPYTPDEYKNRYRINYHDIGLEIYIEGMTAKYVTVTGDAFTGSRGLEERTEPLRAVLDKYMAKPIPQTTQRSQVAHSALMTLDDQTLLEKARSASNGEKFVSLYDRGDLSGHGDDQSKADLALCGLLAFWTGCDALQMDSLFRRSALMRDKWDQNRGNKTYGQMTIEKAIADCRDVYDPTTGRETARQDFNTPLPEAVQLTEEEQQEQLEQARNEYESSTTAQRIGDFFKLIEETSSNPAISTGFPLLDTVLDGGFHPGLYIMGAVSSLGKTTFALQIADAIASSGQDVLFFSIEMSWLELVAKSLSRLTYQLAPKGHPHIAKSTRGIMKGSAYKMSPDLQGYSPEEMGLIKKAADHYRSKVKNIRIIEEKFQIDPVTGKTIGTGAAEIAIAVDNHIKMTGRKPVVFIDYLQILKPNDTRQSDKTNTDQAVKALKQISRDYGIPLFAVSSLNRDSYGSSIHMAAFKESGALEYGSDVLIGIQAEGAGTPGFDIDIEKAKDPRKVELLILKNRNGPTGAVITYDYKPSFNLYTETSMGNKKPKRSPVQKTNQGNDQAMKKFAKMIADMMAPGFGDPV